MVMQFARDFLAANTQARVRLEIAPAEAAMSSRPDAAIMITVRARRIIETSLEQLPQ